MKNYTTRRVVNLTEDIPATIMSEHTRYMGCLGFAKKKWWKNSERFLDPNFSLQGARLLM